MIKNTYILWIPLIMISLASIIKLIKEKTSDGKPFIRIEKEENNE